jgi:hypothetical protein
VDARVGGHGDDHEAHRSGVPRPLAARDLPRRGEARDAARESPAAPRARPTA